MLMYADVCSRMLAYADVPLWQARTCRMLHTTFCIFVLILQRMFCMLHICHTTIYVSLYYYIFVIILLFMCHHTTIYAGKNVLHAAFPGGARARSNGSSMPGTQFTCLTVTKVQILTDLCTSRRARAPSPASPLFATTSPPLFAKP